jgi:hypothetical protein
LMLGGIAQGNQYYGGFGQPSLDAQLPARVSAPTPCAVRSGPSPDERRPVSKGELMHRESLQIAGNIQQYTRKRR